jgi:hypothetical protein
LIFFNARFATGFFVCCTLLFSHSKKLSQKTHSFTYAVLG